MTPDSSAPIFIHSLWRAGSTYLFQVFRRSEAGYYCYQEPLHEIALFNKDTPERLLEYSGDLMRPLRHPELSRPYYQELYDTNRFWKDQITKSDIYDTYFSSECSETLCSFLKVLIEHGQGRTVIQECRTSNRIGALKKFFGGTHIYLWRNPWDQWWSYKATDYFDMIQLLLINAEDAPPVVRTLRQILHFKEYHSESLQDEMRFFNISRLSSANSYCCFYMLWCLAFFEAQQHADFLLNIDQLSVSPDYQIEFHEILSKAGILGLDFSDCRSHCTQFTTQDAAFFKPLEDMVHELLLQHIEAGQVDAIKEARERCMPECQRVLPETASDNVILEDARRTREVVIRLETALNKNMQQQLLLQEQLEREFKQQIDQQKNTAEQQHSDLQRQYEERKKRLALQYADEKQAFNNLLKKYQEKEQSEAQLRLEQIATQDKQHNQEISELKKTAKQENDNLVHNYTMQLETLQEKYTALERELLQEQLESQAHSAHCGNEFSQRLQALRQLADQEKQELNQRLTEQLMTAEQQYAAREKEWLQEQLAMQVRSVEREREFSELLESLHQLADQGNKELRQQFTAKLIVAEQQKAELSDFFSAKLMAVEQEKAVREKELLQVQLAMQTRSTEREREIADQLQALHASYRQAEVAKEERFLSLLNQISSEIAAIHNSRWWQVGIFLGWLPKIRFERLSVLLSVGRYSLLIGETVDQPLAANNIPFPPITFTDRADAVVEEETPKQMDIIDQLLLSGEAEFITKAYQLILGRQADSTGIAHYRRWLRIGKSRVEILADLMASREAQLANRPGLEELRVLIRQTGAGLKGWRKWFALPRIVNHRMAILERHLVQWTTIQRTSGQNLLISREPNVSELLAKVETLLGSLAESLPLHSSPTRACHEKTPKTQHDVKAWSNDPSMMELLKDVPSESADEFFNVFAALLSASKEGRSLSRSSGGNNEIS